MRSVLIAASMLMVPVLSVNAQDKKDAPKGQLPANWGKLGLSDEQKTKIYGIQAEFKTQIDALNKQIADIRKKQMTAMVNVLSAEQKEKLKELAVPDAKPPEKKPETKPAEKKPTDAKPAEKKPNP